MSFDIETVDRESYREQIEWCNFWYDNAVKSDAKRILIIGDSTARMVRSTLSKLLGRPVDLFATSSSIDDILFKRQLNSFFCSYFTKYSTIFVQVGHHGRKGKNGDKYTNEDYIKYRSDLIALIKFLKQFSNNIVVESIFDSVKPKSIFQFLLCKIGLIDEEYDDEINIVTRQKNEIIKQLSKSDVFSDIVFLDINSIIKNHRFIRTDHIHFENKAKLFIAKQMERLVK